MLLGYMQNISSKDLAHLASNKFSCDSVYHNGVTTGTQNNLKLETTPHYHKGFELEEALEIKRSSLSRLVSVVWSCKPFCADIRMTDI